MGSRWFDTGLIGTTTAAVLVVMYPYPIATSAVIPDARPMQPSAHVRVPDYWREMAATINADPSPAKSSYSRWTTTTRCRRNGASSASTASPTCSSNAGGPAQTRRLLQRRARLEADIRSNSDRAAGRRSRRHYRLTPTPVELTRSSLGNDLIRDMPGRNIADDEVLAILKRTPGMTRTANGELGTVADQTGQPLIRPAYNNIVSRAPARMPPPGSSGPVGTRQCRSWRIRPA